MENLSVRRYETLEFEVEADDDSAVSVRFIASQDDTIYIDIPADFVDGKAVIRDEAVTAPLGEYEYTLTIVYSDGYIETMPDAEECEDDCELPILTICKSNLPGVVS